VGDRPVHVVSAVLEIVHLRRPTSERRPLHLHLAFDGQPSPSRCPSGVPHFDPMNGTVIVWDLETVPDLRGLPPLVGKIDGLLFIGRRVCLADQRHGIFDCVDIPDGD
jgi:hypothetical protein